MHTARPHPAPRATNDDGREGGGILVLSHRKPGHDNQALAVARALAAATGRPLRTMAIPFCAAEFLARRLARLGTGIAAPEHVDVIVASGWLPTRVARQLAARSGNAVRLVLMGRKAGAVPASGAVVIRSAHFGLPPHPAQCDTVLPLNAGTVRSNHPPAEKWQPWLDAPRRVAVLVGGDSRSHALDADHARELARHAGAWADSLDARLLVVTSRRTGRAFAGLQRGLPENALLYAWQADDTTNPYAIALARADALTVTGESESMLADAVSSGRPVFIWPIPARRVSVNQRVGNWLIHHARTAAVSNGRIRSVFDRLCLRALERGWVLPARQPELLHRALIERGCAAWFGSPMASPRAPLDELSEVVDEVIDRLQLDASSTTGAAKSRSQR